MSGSRLPNKFRLGPLITKTVRIPASMFSVESKHAAQSLPGQASIHGLRHEGLPWTGQQYVSYIGPQALFVQRHGVQEISRAEAPTRQHRHKTRSEAHTTELQSQPNLVH